MCTCEMWDELGFKPCIWIETVKLPAPLKTSPLPVTPLAFIEPIAKADPRIGDGDAVAVVAAPPQAMAETKNRIAAVRRIIGGHPQCIHRIENRLASQAVSRLLQSACDFCNDPPDRLYLVLIHRVSHVRVQLQRRC